tara:strand:- start:285 stop:1193 length:909 start_codon:yes stop_codon:yes gene_type:complete
MAIIRPEQLSSGTYSITGSFTGSFKGDGSQLTGLSIPNVSGTINTVPIFTSTNAIGDSTITYDGESYLFNDLDGGGVYFNKDGGPPGGSRISIIPDDATADTLVITPSSLVSSNNFLTLQGSKGVTLNANGDTATFEGGTFTLQESGGGDQVNIPINGDIEFVSSGGTVSEILSFPGGTTSRQYTLPTATGTVALLNNSGSGLFEATGSFTGSFIGDGSQLTGISINPFPFTGDAVITGSLEIKGTGESLFLIRDGNDSSVLEVSQSGVVVLSTQSIELTETSAPNGGIYFTSTAFFIGLDT